MTIDEMIAVLQAAKAGKQIQILATHTDLGWQDCHSPYWDFSRTNYRVKPEPREWWVHKDILDGNGGFYSKYFPGTVHVREVLP